MMDADSYHSTHRRRIRSVSYQSLIAHGQLYILWVKVQDSFIFCTVVYLFYIHLIGVQCSFQRLMAIYDLRGDIQRQINLIRVRYSFDIVIWFFRQILTRKTPTLELYPHNTSTNQNTFVIAISQPIIYHRQQPKWSIFTSS